LYMCPELVDEKPYDHSADLWFVKIWILNFVLHFNFQGSWLHSLRSLSRETTLFY